MEVDEITGAIVTAAIQIHKDIGSGLFESAYEVLLARALHRRVGLLLNFGAETMLEGAKRVINHRPQ